MPLNLYREHIGTCSQKRRVRLHTRKAEESPRFGWKKCDCPIYASGTLRDGFKRRKTRHTTWPEAEAEAKGWEQAGAWAASPFGSVLKAEPERLSAAPSAKKIEDALRAFIVKCEGRKIEDSTLRKYKTFAKQFQAFCDKRGYVVGAQLTEGDGDLFYATWKDGPKATGKKLERFRRLVRFWLKKKWITNDLGVFDIERPIGANEAADRLPFSDDELDRLYGACDDTGTITWTNGMGSDSWNGEDAKEFIMLSIYTGLRISDVATFDVKERLQGNNIFLRAKKNKERLFTWVPDWLRDRLLDRERLYGSRIFQTGKSERLETVTDLWRRKMSRIFALAQRKEPFSQKPTPHRFRYTFVRILLERGVPVPDVAELAGDTVEVIEKHYKRWVPELQDRLTNILKSAFEDRPKLVAIKKQQG